MARGQRRPRPGHPAKQAGATIAHFGSLRAPSPLPLSRLCQNCGDGPHGVRGACCNPKVGDTTCAHQAIHTRTVKAHSGPRLTTRPISDPCAPSSGRNQHGRSRSYTEAFLALGSHFALWMVVFPDRHCDPSSPMQEMAVHAGAQGSSGLAPATQAHRRRCRAPIGARAQRCAPIKSPGAKPAMILNLDWT